MQMIRLDSQARALDRYNDNHVDIALEDLLQKTLWRESGSRRDCARRQKAKSAVNKEKLCWVSPSPSTPVSPSASPLLSSPLVSPPPIRVSSAACALLLLAACDARR